MFSSLTVCFLVILALQRPHPATTQELQKFHSEDYVNFLQRITPEAARGVHNSLQKFNVGEYTDCPVFDGLIEFCKLYTGGSLGACTARQEVFRIWVSFAALAWH
jgi:acetoin utilization deacetylase AcuC-like enzyme